MEHPDYGEKPIIHPSESTRLWCTRLYLERVKEALVAAGGTYTTSQAELKAADFEENIPAISKLVFSIGGFFGGYETRTYTLDEKQLHLDVEHSLILKPTNYDFHRTRWNLLTVEQSKGLEFGSVIAVSGRMTPNRKYIAFTRALDELIIYDNPLSIRVEDNAELMPDKQKEDQKIFVKQDKKGKKADKPTTVVDYSKSEVVKYFKSKGLEVIDMRNKGGALWVIGDQVKIKQYVDEACERLAFRVLMPIMAVKQQGIDRLAISRPRNNR